MTKQNKSAKRRGRQRRATYDTNVFASPEAAAAAALVEQTVAELDIETVERFLAGSEIYEIKPTGKGGRWRVRDIRRAAAKAREVLGEELLPSSVEEQEAVAPVAEEVGAPEAIEAPEIIEVAPPAPEPEVVPEVVEEQAPEIVEERPAPGLGERIREFFAGIRMPEVRIPTLVPIAGVVLIALILFTILAVSALDPQGSIRQWLAAPGQRSAALQDAKADLKGQVETARNEVVTLEESLDRAKVAYADLELETAARVAELEDEKSALQEELDEESAKVAAHEAEKATLETQVSDIEVEKATSDQKVAALEQELKLEKTASETRGAALEEQISKVEGEKVALEDRVAKIAAEKAALESAFNEVTAERDQLAAKLEQVARVVVEEDNTIWDLLTQTLGKAPTRDQIQSVVDANSLTDLGVNAAGQWIVLIYAGQTIDLSPALSG